MLREIEIDHMVEEPLRHPSCSLLLDPIARVTKMSLMVSNPGLDVNCETMVIEILG
jgi:hypothetical protein